MPLCKVCNKDRFLIYKRYQGEKLEIPRCIACIVRFPLSRTELALDGNGIKTYTNQDRKYHGWALIKQTKQLDIWKCQYCKLSLVSPKLGIPLSTGCMRGSNYRPKKGWWGSIKIENMLCPLCDMDAELMNIPRINKKRPGLYVFLFSCPECFS